MEKTTFQKQKLNLALPTTTTATASTSFVPTPPVPPIQSSSPPSSSQIQAWYFQDQVSQPISITVTSTTTTGAGRDLLYNEWIEIWSGLRRLTSDHYFWTLLGKENNKIEYQAVRVKLPAIDVHTLTTSGGIPTTTYVYYALSPNLIKKIQSPLSTVSISRRVLQQQHQVEVPVRYDSTPNTMTVPIHALSQEVIVKIIKSGALLPATFDCQMLLSPRISDSSTSTTTTSAARLPVELDDDLSKTLGWMWQARIIHPNNLKGQYINIWAQLISINEMEWIRWWCDTEFEYSFIRTHVNLSTLMKNIVCVDQKQHQETYLEELKTQNKSFILVSPPVYTKIHANAKRTSKMSDNTTTASSTTTSKSNGSNKKKKTTTEQQRTMMNGGGGGDDDGGGAASAATPIIASSSTTIPLEDKILTWLAAYPGSLNLKTHLYNSAVNSFSPQLHWLFCCLDQWLVHQSIDPLEIPIPWETTLMYLTTRRTRLSILSSNANLVTPTTGNPVSSISKVGENSTITMSSTNKKPSPPQPVLSQPSVAPPQPQPPPPPVPVVTPPPPPPQLQLQPPLPVITTSQSIPLEPSTSSVMSMTQTTTPSWTLLRPLKFRMRPQRDEKPIED